MKKTFHFLLNENLEGNEKISPVIKAILNYEKVKPAISLHLFSIENKKKVCCQSSLFEL